MKKKITRRNFLTALPLAVALTPRLSIASPDIILAKKEQLPPKNPHFQEITSHKVLQGNENCLGCSDDCFSSITTSWGDWNRYVLQRDSLEKLRTDLGTELNIDRAYIRFAPGSTASLRIIVQKLMKAGESFLVTDPDFNRVQKEVTDQDGKIILVPHKNYSADLSEMQKKANEVRLVYLSSPQIPYGGMNSLADIENFLKKLPADIFLIVDEAYIQYAAKDYEKLSAIPLTVKYKNLIVVRTFSKIYGLAAMRVGFLVTHPNTIRKMRYNDEDEYSIAGVSLLAARFALKDKKHLEKSRKHVNEMKDKMEIFSKKNKIIFNRGYGNFFTFFFERDSRYYVEHLAKNKMNLKLRGGKFLWITMDTETQLERFSNSMQEII